MRLIVKQGGVVLQTVELPPLEPDEDFTIGRAEGYQLVLANSSVSRCHASIAWDGTDYVLTDQNSMNGTSVNGT